MKNHTEHGHGEENMEAKNKRFESEIGLRKKFDQTENLISEIKNDSLERILQKTGECVVCMDEGTANIRVDSKVCLAGSGILMYADLPREERLQKVAKLLVDNGVKTVTSHDGCGAAKIAAAAIHYEGDPDELAKTWSKDLQEEVNKLEVTGEYRHIGKDEMTRPQEYHVATGVWLDASKTRRFNPEKLEDAPNQFVVDLGLAQDSSYSMEEVKVAVGIAFGHHGFEKLLNEENKFLITVLADDEDELSEVERELEKTLSDEKFTEVRQFIEIKGVVLPVKQKKLRKEIGTPTSTEVYVN